MPSTKWRACEGGDQCVLYKNNSDGKGNSYGYHENYLMSRDGSVRTDRESCWRRSL